MNPQRARGLARLAIVLAVVAVAGILIANSNDAELIIFGSTPSYPHQLQITAPSAFEAIPGERVVEGGAGIGTILSTDVTKQAQAHLVIGISDAAWPIPTDSMFTLRMGGTIKFTDRFINIAKGRAGTNFADNASVPARQFVVPVEYDSLFNIFNGQTRTALKGFFDNGGPTLAAAQQSFRRALQAAPPVLGQADHVFQDLGYNQQALSTLVSSTAQLSDAVAASNPGLKTLIQSAASTFGTIGAQSTTIKQILDLATPSLYDMGVGLTDLGHTYARLEPLARRLHSGVQQLGLLSAPLDSTLREVVNIEPSAVQTLNTVATSGPALNRFLTDARTSLLPQLQSVSAQAAVELNCIRPYTPDIVAFAQGWAGMFGDGLVNPHVHMLHSLVSILPIPDGSLVNSTTMEKFIPGVHTNFPQVPGAEWNQLWYQPQCNITPATVTQDPESGTYDPKGTKIVPFNSTTPSYAPAPHPN